MRYPSKNEFSILGFLFSSFFWSIVALLGYQNMLFCCIPNTTYRTSKIIILFILLVVHLFGLIWQGKYYRNDNTIAFNVIIALGIYSTISYWDKKAVVILILAVLLMAAIILNYVIFRGVNPGQRSTSLLQLINKWTDSSCHQRQFQLIGTALAVFLVTLLIPRLFGEVYPAKLVEIPSQSEVTIEDNIDSLVVLAYPEKWKDLSIEEKLTVLQTAATIEASHFSLQNEVIVGTKTLSDEIDAHYIWGTHQVIINTYYLNSLEEPFDVLRILLHEMKHALQYEAVEAWESMKDGAKKLVVFQEIEQAAEELRDYERWNLDLYREQLIEQDAEQYADIRIYDYTSILYSIDLSETN